MTSPSVSVPLRTTPALLLPRSVNSTEVSTGAAPVMQVPVSEPAALGRQVRLASQRFRIWRVSQLADAATTGRTMMSSW